MKSLSRIFTAGVVVGLAGSAFAQTALTPLWKVDPASSLPFFGNDNNTRGLNFNTASGNILVASRTTSNSVRRVNPATGVEVLPPLSNVTYAAGGTFPINKALPTSAGVVYVTNLANPAATFNISRHSDENAAPTTAYSQAAVTVRIGDDAAITGTGNGTKILVSGSGSTVIASFTTADGGVTFTRGTDITPTGPVLTGIPNVAFDTDGNSFWVRKSSASASENPLASLYTSAGAGTLTTTGVVSGGPIAVAQLGTRKVIATSPGEGGVGSSNVKASINTADAGGALLYQSGSLEAGAAALANINGAGDISIDTVGNRLFVLYTNNSISGWSIPNLTGVTDWNLY